MAIAASGLPPDALGLPEPESNAPESEVEPFPPLEAESELALAPPELPAGSEREPLEPGRPEPAPPPEACPATSEGTVVELLPWLLLHP